MKLLFTGLSFLLLPLFCMCQINTSLDFIAGVDLGYRNLRVSNDDPNSGGMLVSRSRNNNEIGNLNLRFGFNFNKRISNQIVFKTGVRFASVGYKRKKKDDLIFGSEIIDQFNDPSIPPTPLGSIQFFYNYLFLEVPLIGRYEFNQKKFSPFVELGIAPSLYLKSRNKVVYNGDTEMLDGDEDLYDYSKIHFVGVLAFGGNYRINEGLQLFAQPTFRYHLTRLVKDVPIKEHLWNIGLELGLRKRLR